MFDPLDYLITVGKEHRMTEYFQCFSRDGFGGKAGTRFWNCKSGIQNVNIFLSIATSISTVNFVYRSVTNTSDATAVTTPDIV